MRTKARAERIIVDAFSRAWQLFYILASGSDWFVGLFAVIVIGQSNKLGLYFTTNS